MKLTVSLGPMMLTAFVILLSSTSLAQTPPKPATDDQLRAMIVGTWSDPGGCAIVTVVFKADGTFASGYIGYQLIGTYQIVNGQIVGKHDMPQSGDGPGGEMKTLSIRFDSGKLVMFDPATGANPDDSLTRCP
jgi:hypothetical protein